MNIRAPGFTRWIRADILVAEGEETNLGDIKLVAGGTIRGTLFDAAGRPLVGGSIQVVCDDGREGIGYSTKSGSDGKFMIMNVSPACTRSALRARPRRTARPSTGSWTRRTRASPSASRTAARASSR
jgi:hypothetical protein